MRKFTFVVIFIIVLTSIVLFFRSNIKVDSVPNVSEKSSKEVFDDSVNPWRLKENIETSVITALEWSVENNNNNNASVSWFDAENYCKNLVSSGGIKSDVEWRLPTVEELMMSNLLKIPNDFQHDFYWSGTTIYEDSNQAWYVYMKDKGGPGSWLKKDATTPWSVRCVR